MEPKSKPVRIMVVDDDIDTLTILSRHLEHAGFEAVGASSGPDCLRLLEQGAVEIILLDLMMPGMDGFEVCEVLKRNPGTAAIPIIMVTARDDIETRAEGIRLGISEFLAKPFSRSRLLQKIQAQLDVLAAGRATDAALSRLAQQERG